MKKFILFILISASQILFAQQFTSIHHEQAQYYRSLGEKTDAEYDAMNQHRGRTDIQNRSACVLNKKVYGWHPYWMGTAYNNYQWNLLSDLSFFGYEVDENTGNAISTHGWSTANVVTVAQTNGVNVTLTATLFSGHATFFGSSTSQQTLITNLINLVQARNAKGVNIDFEGVPLSQKTAFANFMANLCDQMHAAIPGSQVSMALYAVDWNGVFDFSILVPKVDLFIIMGYDYYYGGSTTAGPVDPLYSLTTGYDYNLTKSITYYLNKGVPNSKLILGLPYYGRQWSVSSFTIPATTTGSSASNTYKVVRDNASGYFSTKIWNSTSQTPYYNWTNAGTNYQCWALDANSVARRLDLINQRNIGGMGIWALGYDDGYTDLWSVIQDKLTTCATNVCTDTIWDMGGPSRNYYNNENYTFTIQPTGASGVSLNFTQFDIETNYDYLYIYDGNSTASPLIGTYTGTSSPGVVNSTGNALTLRFTSDGATVRPGFTAIQSCIVDNTPPTTSISSTGTWKTADFTASFNDNDPAPNSSGLKYKFYQVSDHNSPWRSNTTNEFFTDDFEGTAIHPDWTSYAGSWSIVSNKLFQSDETNANTILSASLPQNNFSQYLYHFKGLLNGSGTNRRAGLHFMCDNASSTNRGNSYFIYFRADSDKLQIYDVNADVFTLQVDATYVFDPAIEYDFKIMYDKTSGEIWVYVNDVLSAQWKDNTPLTSGNYVSWRSGNCTYTVNDFRVYHNRTGTATISVCNSTSDIRYSNPNASDPSGMIRSVVIDNAKNISAVSQSLINVDCSTPIAVASVNDGTGLDIDAQASNTSISGNFSASSDANSDIVDYEYAIGTTPGATDIVNFTSTSNSLTFTRTGLSLTDGATYYITIRAKNGAGLYSTVAISDGVTINTLLPLNFVDFNVQKTADKNVELRLLTTNEKDVESIDIMYSYDGIHFEKIHSLIPKNTNTLNEYIFTHSKSELKRNNYYKCMALSNTNKIAETNVKSIRIQGSLELSIIKNETETIARIYAEQEQEAILEVISAEGKTLFSVPIHLFEGEQTLSIPIDFPRSSISFYTLKTQKEFVTTKQ